MKTPESILKPTREALNKANALAIQAQAIRRGVWVIQGNNAVYTLELDNLFGWRHPKATVQVLALCALCDYSRQAVVIYSAGYTEKYMYRVDLI